MSDSHVVNLAQALQEFGEILTVQEVATALRMREDTITNWLANGQLRGFQIGRAWRVVKRDLLEDIAARYNTGTPPATAAGDDADA